MNVKALSGADLARCFGVDRSMVTRWKKAGMPENKGLFSLPECIKWRLEREADAMAPKNAVSTEGEKWLTAFRKERARISRIERRKLQGEVINRADVVSEWVNRILCVRQGMLALEHRLTPRLEGKSVSEMRTIIHEEAYCMLTNYSRGGNYCKTPEETIDREKYDDEADADYEEWKEAERKRKSLESTGVAGGGSSIQGSGGNPGRGDHEA